LDLRENRHIASTGMTMKYLNQKSKKGIKMNEEKTECQKPDKLKGKPEDCTPEQIKECHGDDKEHECESKKEKESEN